MITSTSSSQVKHVLQLQKKAKTRKEFKEFVVEGHKMVAEAGNDRLVKVYESETFAQSNPEFISENGIDESKVEKVTDHIFSQMSDTKTPQGVMAIVSMKHYELKDMLNDKSLFIMVENLQDPGNLGTIVRMGEGAGISGVIMSPATVDIYNPKTIRSTMGSIYRVPFLYAQDWKKTVEQVQAAGVTIYAAHLDGKNEYTQEDYRTGSAFLIGNEGNGLTEETTAMADTLIRIPMEGQVESLNAAIACTILSYEAARQRRQ